MSKVQFTKNQQSCIDVNGGNILVSAAAGSGKTAVLTERVIKLLTGENPISADRLVIVTFTVLAADEMRQRIQSKLSELIENDPTNKALQNQQLLLANAKISTIHALCSSLIRDHFQKLGLSGDFRIADETELTIIKNDSVNEIFEALYETDDADFLKLIEFVCTKDDKKLVDLILSIYDFIRSFAFPKKFLEDTLVMYQTANSIKESVWYQSISEHVIDALNSSVMVLTDALEQMETDEKVKECYYESFAFDKQQFIDIIHCLQEGEWDNAISKVNNFEKMKLKSVRGYEDKDFLEALKGKRASAQKTLESVSKHYLCCSEAEFKEDIAILLPRLHTLFSLVNQVYDKIEEKKQEQGIIDYADLEHYTVQLLVNRTDTGYEKTEVAKELSESFDEIMIDECQDINEVQNLIFKVLSKDEQNIFMVGDVKQSVYRFRKAMPKLFIDKKNVFPKYNQDTHQKDSNALITLESNFRSRSEVCDTVNYIFSQIMSANMGEIDYNEEESLVPAAKYDPYEEACSEVHIVNYAKEDDREKAVVEAHYIGKLIKRMIAEGYQVQGKKGMRNCTYRDFAILLRAKKDKGTIFANELNAMDIPCFSDSTEGYFNEYEITVTLNLLKIIDNPLLDVCLLSVLMSPMFHFSADTITKIRLTAKNVPLYIAVTQCAKEDKQCQEFIDILTTLRQKAATVKTDEIIQEIYDQTDFLSLCYAMGNGEQKDANLRLLLTYAKQYESIGTSGLSGFLRYIERVIENKQDFSCANTISQNANTVKIMSIHSSKGLEFPICILADCGKKFNKMDLNKSYQFNSQLGFGMKITDQQALKSYTNIPYEAIRLQTEKETISEEMRVLYVALTRAKEKLIMVMTMEKAIDKIARIAQGLPTKSKLSPYDVYSATSYADWILSAALRHESLFNIRSEICGVDVPIIASSFQMKGYLVDTTQQDAVSVVAEKEHIAKPNQAIIDELNNSFAYEYPYQELTEIPAKLTVTQIAKQKRDAEITLKVEPSFLQKQGITPAMRGTILHSFMQFADYTNAKSDLDKEITRLVQQQFLTQEQADALNIPKVEAFLKSSLFSRMQQASKVLREYKFLHFIKATDVDENLPKAYQEQEILIQGIADCLLFEEDGIVLVDYKTDYVDDEAILMERYFDQLRIYKQAVESAFHQPVKQCLLYALHLEKEVEINC